MIYKMKIIKLIMALGIFICLFLPLSQCTGISEKHSDITDTVESVQIVQDNEPKEVRENNSNIHIVISGIDDVVDIEKIPVLIGFILPLLFCVSFAKRKWMILSLILQTANQFWLMYLTYVLVWLLSEPLWSGYILTFCTAIYFLITFIEWINFFRKKTC